jgi:hypothetical protein
MAEGEQARWRRVTCDRCKVDVVWPGSLSREDKRLMAAAVRRSTVEGMEFAHRALSMALRGAKALSLHVTRVPATCHRCSLPLAEEVSVCQGCQSANLDW